ncbi:MAG: hypothetical protein WC393_03795 [Candidatus Nanoarchaeia archaeon]|jgi:hypothetical protein
MAEIIEKLKKSDFKWLATGRFAIDNILSNKLEQIDCFSIIVPESDKKKCDNYIKNNNILNINIIYSKCLDNEYFLLNGIQTVFDEKNLEETAPRYYSNNKILLKKKIEEYRKMY